jgi:hypothetical protein
MTARKGNNYTGAYVTVPSVKYPPGEFAGGKKVLIERYTLSSIQAVNDTLAVGKLPPGSFITGAKVFINKSLGATGIFDLGHLASQDESGNVIAANVDGLVKSADAGGQAVLAGPTLVSDALYKRFGLETELQLICTEVMDGSVLDAVLVVEVEYVNK